MQDDTRLTTSVAAFKYELPETLLNTSQWQELPDRIGFGWDGIHVRETFPEQPPEGRTAFKCPSPSSAGNPVAYREVIAGQLGKWLGVRVPHAELLRDSTGPCALLFPPGKSILTYQSVMKNPAVIPKAATKEVQALAHSALHAHAGIFVLDALVGVGNRLTHPHFYVEDRQEWYSTGYGLGPCLDPAEKMVVGDDALAYHQQYTLFLEDGMEKNRDALNNTLDRAERIPDKRLGELINLIPEDFLLKESRSKVLLFLQERRKNIREILRSWCRSHGLGEVID